MLRLLGEGRGMFRGDPETVQYLNYAARVAGVGAIDFVAQTQTFRYECPTQILFSF